MLLVLVVVFVSILVGFKIIYFQSSSMLTLDKSTGRYSFKVPDCHNKLN